MVSIAENLNFNPRQDLCLNLIKCQNIENNKIKFLPESIKRKPFHSEN